MKKNLQSLLVQCFDRWAQLTDALYFTAGQKAQALQYVREKLYQAARDIDEMAPELKDNAALSSCGRREEGPADCSFTFSGNIDLNQLTGYDKQKLKPALKALNDVCQRHNISLDVVGLGGMPCDTLTTEFFSASNESGENFMVAANARRPYNADFNPYDDAQVQQKFELSKDKGPAQ